MAEIVEKIIWNDVVVCESCKSKIKIFENDVFSKYAHCIQIDTDYYFECVVCKHENQLEIAIPPHVQKIAEEKEPKPKPKNDWD